jgi:hypothetical protein
MVHAVGSVSGRGLRRSSRPAWGVDRYPRIGSGASSFMVGRCNEMSDAVARKVQLTGDDTYELDVQTAST